MFSYILQLGAELSARAISHLEEVSEAGIQAMSDKSVVAVVLPTTAYILRLKPPPVRKMIEAGKVKLRKRKHILSLLCNDKEGNAK